MQSFSRAATRQAVVGRRSFSIATTRMEPKVSQQGPGQVSSVTSDHSEKDLGTGPETVGKTIGEAMHNKPNNVKSHATTPEDSVFPQIIQDYVPETVERALPEALHPTEGKKN
ncbi:MAG: hypothetical protein CYPHOPRED_002080 [Cyphobasidiales sp. Tagirdzhanova-0007]|nr:MAG: hypothetical protein CYPHOPRED_002080 [Cyphobasidiales sp. Tagirdzhanova-0007]